MWRQGDVLIAQIDTIPFGASKRSNTVLAEGEITGHQHQVEDPATAEVWGLDGELFLKVIGKSATLIHEEHKAIKLVQGLYRVWRQREYTPQALRTVAD